MAHPLTGRVHKPGCGHCQGGWRRLNIQYGHAHRRARAALPAACAHADETCSPTVETALRFDAPEEFVRTDPHGRRFYVGDDSADGYIPLCRSHHRVYDNGSRCGSPVSPCRGNPGGACARPSGHPGTHKSPAARESERLRDVARSA